jgi:integrase/recombinase XerD
MIAAYLDHLRVERRLAAHTLESYARDLAALAAYADEAHLQPEALDRASLEEFVRRQMTRGLSPRSVARLVAAVRGFYRFLVLDRRLDRNPADDLRPPRAWPALPKFLSLEDVDTLIAQPDVTTPRGLRDRAMIELLYATGLRVTELVGVRLADLHLDDHYLTCIGKGSKERLVPIGDEASEWIAKYQATARRALLKGRTTPRLFVNARGGPLSRVGFWKILKHHGRTGCRARSAPTCSVTRSPRICSSGVRTCAPSS